uniref:Uncharacterized protein n=1 Tax=Vitis vinifera TaxID=29760 RepID=A5C197_VITVI|nr:hypothetical protein VITISV_030642 [Vitis vinifera]
MRPRKNVVVLSERTLDTPSLFECQEGANMGEMSAFLRDLDCLQGVCHRGIFIRRVLPKMALKGDKSSTIENCTLRMIGPAWTSSTTSPREVVAAPLNPEKIRLGFSRPESSSPICLITDTYKRSAELPGSTRIHLTSKSPIPRDRMRVSRCGCNIRVGSSRGKMIVPSIGWALPPVNSGRMELTHSCTDAA